MKKTKKSGTRMAGATRVNIYVNDRHLEQAGRISKIIGVSRATYLRTRIQRGISLDLQKGY